ncbi:MAG: lmo0937 family membrane protein [Candidatus Acidiferrum sp.]
MRFGPFLAIAALLFIFWIGGFLVFHVAGALIHILLLIAIVSLFLHIFTSSKTA